MIRSTITSCRRMWRPSAHRPVALAAVAILALSDASPLAAQCAVTDSPGICTVDLGITMSTTSAMMLTLSTETTTFPPVGTTDWNNKYVAVAGPTASVSANRSWQLQISSLTETWTPTGTFARTDKPASDLLWATSSTGTFNKFATTSVASSVSGAQGENLQTSFFFRAVLGMTADPPGSYSLTVRFTLLSP